MIVASGSFPFASGHKSVARIDASGAVDDTFAGGYAESNSVEQIACDSQDRIYLSGDFIDYENILNSFVRLSANGVLDLSFTPALSFGLNPTLESLEVLSDDEVVVGTQTMYGFIAVQVFNSFGNVVDKPFGHLGINSSITTSHFDGATLYFGGRIASENSENISGVGFVNIIPVTGTVGNLQVTREGLTKAELTWTDNTLKGKLIVIERSVGNNNSFAEIATLPLTATSYQDSNLVRALTYYYRVQVINSSSASAFSTTAFIDAAPKLNQAISLEDITIKKFGDAPFALIATTPSGLPITFSSSDPLVASIQGSTVTIKKAGSVTITASQSGGEDYNPATSVNKTLEITKSNQAITFGLLPEKTTTDSPFNLAATSSSALAVSFESSDATVASVIGSLVTIHKTGTTTMKATQIGNENYNPAQSVDQTLTITKSTQEIAFGLLPEKTSTDSPFNLTATSSSGLTVSFESSDATAASVIGSLVTLHKAGTTTIKATQIGNEKYSTASPVERTLKINTITGLEDEFFLEREVYPNPGTGIFNIKLKSGVSTGSYQVLTTNGASIMKNNFASVDGIVTLDLSYLPEGTYILKLSANKSETHFRIMKR
jgi:hypothetical protein